MNFFVFRLGFEGMIFAAAAVLGFLFTVLMVPLSKSMRFLDRPGWRKGQTAPVPCLGGVAVFLAVWWILLPGFVAYRSPSVNLVGFSYILSPQVFEDINLMLPKLKYVFWGSVLLLVVGLIDDRFELKPWSKLAAQIAAGCILIRGGFMIDFVSEFGFLGKIVTLLWILTIINAFNFIDMMNGHCAGITLIGCFFFWILTYVISQPFVGILAAACAGAVFGFLPFNFARAKIYLGDNGSLSLGYLMAAFTLMLTYWKGDAMHTARFLPLLLFWLPPLQLAGLLWRFPQLWQLLPQPSEWRSPLLSRPPDGLLQPAFRPLKRL